jgi:hypothetical protein
MLDDSAFALNQTEDLSAHTLTYLELQAKTRDCDKLRALVNEATLFVQGLMDKDVWMKKALMALAGE